MTLDPAQDPDRYDPSKDTAPTEPPSTLDPELDPDRYRPPLTLPELLGDGAYEDEREGLEWLWGLLGVLAFLAFITAAIYLL